MRGDHTHESATARAAEAALGSQPARPPIHWLTLRFHDGTLQARYDAAHEAGRLSQIRLCYFVGAGLNLIVGPLDFFALSENVLLGVVLRVVVVTALLMALAGLTFLPRLKRHAPALGVIGTLGFAGFYAALNIIGGTPDIYLSGFVLVILFVLVFFPLGLGFSCLAAVTATVVFAVATTLTRGTPVVDMMTLYYQYGACNVIGMFALYWIERYRRVGFFNLERIDAARGRYHDLLTRILPRSIAARLERGEREIADDFSETTVLFADIVGFTAFSATHRPAEVVALLNAVFARFDALVERHAVEKIKTIGDAYLVAGGLPEAKPDHCEAIAALALDMMAAAGEMRTADGEPVAMRIGIHTGPVIAGVIGDKRFLYDLWGDTVNIASRMESAGTPGHIQVSDAVRDRLAATHRFERRGAIEVKGRGAMSTWYLTGTRAA